MNQQSFTEIRRALHTEPELAFEENATAEKVTSFLRSCQPSQLLTEVGGTGVVAIFDSGKEGETVLFRAELDALPIQEINDFEYRSQTDQVAHKCGHDGHTAILLGLARKLTEEPVATGRVVLLFQPAEETGEGAKAVLEDSKFAEIQPDYAFALHNLPGHPMHQVVVKVGAFTAAVKSLIIELHGKTAHAAEPENGISPALPLAEILLQTVALSNNQPEQKDFAVVTPIQAEMGKIAYGTAAGYGELRLTIRTWTVKEMKNLSSRILKIVDTISAKYQIESRTEWTQQFVTNKNNKEAIDLIRHAARLHDLEVSVRKVPFKWGEDFGLFTQRFKGAMFGLGAGEQTPALHNPDYDFPDELIETGVNLFNAIAQKILS